MFSRELSFAGHTRRFVLHALPSEGWEVRIEQDDRVVRQVRYDDWHRVERALNAVEREVMVLQENGWQMVSGAFGLDQSTKR
jgi:hypothetical protein